MLAQLGRGGMGVVLSAWDPELDRKVAIKLLRRSGAEAASDGTAQLVREAQALARVSHPNVVSVFDVGTSGAEVFLAMELVDGVTLGRWLERKRSWRETLRALVHAGRGLAAVHAAGLVHRDVKPDNVMVSDDGRVRLMDLGIAHSSAEITEPGGLVGTPAYMAPEQFGGEAGDARSDQFSFCVTAWEALFGERPFTGETLVALTLSVTDGRIDEPRTGRGVPRWVRRVLERGLERDPAKRWPDMNALVAAAGADPRARLRILGAGAAVVSVVAGAVAFPIVQTGLRDRGCRDEAADTTASWNADRRASIDEAIRATALPYSDRTAEVVGERLDAFATALADASHSACIARESGDEAVPWEHASACLADRRASLEAQLELLDEPDGAVVRGAVSAVSGLPPPERCLDRTASVEALPPAELRAEVHRLVVRLAQTKAQQALGLYEQADRSAVALVDEAEALGWTPLVARAHQTAGAAATALRRDADAVVQLESAFFAALRADEPDLAAQAAIDLMDRASQAQADYDLAARWGKTAESLLARLGEEESRLQRAELLASLAALTSERGDLHLALAQIEESRTMYEAVLGPDHPHLAVVYDRAAGDLAGLGRYDDALALHRRALALRETSLGPDHPAVGTSYASLGTVQLQMGATGDALASHRRALEIKQRSYLPGHPELATAMNNLATVHLALGRYAESLEWLEPAVRDAAAHLPENHPDLATLLGNLGAAYQGLGRHAEAAERFREALRIQEVVRGPDHAAVGDALNNVGAAELVLENWPAARAAHERALEIRIGALGPEHPSVAMSHLNLAVAVRGLNEPAEALRHAELAHRIWTQTLGKDHSYVAGAWIERAEAELDLGRFDAAAEHAEAGIDACVASRAPAEWLAAGRFVLARALGERGERARARALAIAARDHFRTVAKVHGQELEEIEAWLARP